MKIKFVAVLSVLSVLVACAGPSAKDGVVKSQERSGGLFGMVTQDTVKVTTGDAFKGAQKVVIGGFTVGFATYKTDSAKAGGGLFGSGFGGKSTATSTLTGIDAAAMQKITDAAYKGFIADLKVQGYEVVDRNELLNYKDFKSSKSYDSPYEESSGGIFGASSKTLYVAPTGFGGIRSFMGDLTGFTGGFGFANPFHGAAAYAKETGVKVLSVVYVLDFANSESYGNWATTTSSVTVGQGMTILPEYTKLSVFGGDMGTFSSANGSVALGQPVMSERLFAEAKETSSDAYKAAEAAVNVVGLLGGVGSNKSREFEFIARSADYEAASLEAIQKTNNLLIGKAASLR